MSEIDVLGGTAAAAPAGGTESRTTGLTRRVILTLLGLASAVAIVVMLGWRLQSGPLGGAPLLRELMFVGAAMLGLGGLLCVWILDDVNVGWHRDGAAATGILVCMAGTVALGWTDGPTAIRSAGGVVGPLVVAALLDPVVRRALGAHAATRVVIAAIVVVAAASVVVYMVRDPFHDPDCRIDCALEDVAPLPSRPAADVAVGVLTVVMVSVAVVAWGLIARMVAGRHHATDMPDMTIAVAATVALTAAVSTNLSADLDAQTVALGIMASALAVLGTLFGVQPVMALERRRRLRQVAFALGDAPAPGTLEPVLARALGDREVRVAYWLPESQVYVDAEGRPVPDAAGWTVTLARDDQPLAALRLGRTDRNPAEVQELVGSAARLAIDSERLQAAIRAQLTELQDSRQRIVAAADASRRRVERTIHDVVQAELLGVLFDLARARKAADESGDRIAGNQLAQTSAEVGAVVAGIREFARGVYPAALDAAGLDAALGALADEAPVVLTVDNTLTTRLPADSERAIYLLVQHLVGHTDAHLAVRIDRVGPEVVVLITDVREPVPDHVTDRIGALGGRCRVQGVQLEVALPCE